MRLYWAYGSNLCKKSMRLRCPDARPAGSLEVHDAALVFRLFADVVVQRGSSVHGGLWWISPEDEMNLDRYEGVSQRLYVKRYLRMKVGERVRKVLFYQMGTDRGIMPPGQSYVDVITQGYKDFGLPLEALSDAVAGSWSDKKVTEFLRGRHDRKGKPRLARQVAL